MTSDQEENTLTVIKPDSFWRELNRQVESRLKALGLKVVAECILTGGENLAEEKWREFYFPAIGGKPCLGALQNIWPMGRCMSCNWRESVLSRKCAGQWAPPGHGRRSPAQFTGISGRGRTRPTRRIT